MVDALLVIPMAVLRIFRQVVREAEECGVGTLATFELSVTQSRADWRRTPVIRNQLHIWILVKGTDLISTAATKISVGVDVCMTYERHFYFNLPEVQKALHANRISLPYSWSMCRRQSDGLEWFTNEIVFRLLYLLVKHDTHQQALLSPDPPDPPPAGRRKHSHRPPLVEGAPAAPDPLDLPPVDRRKHSRHPPLADGTPAARYRDSRRKHALFAAHLPQHPRSAAACPRQPSPSPEYADAATRRPRRAGHRITTI
ncbi:hypothetical protein Syun_017072 [Stephania yunnanensis]|uniref:Uncharacterized protein n=1 Tax=Stephania yunnanensis TaxID=152371 RepID=A0AAP0P4L3_9MAGN